MYWRERSLLRVRCKNLRKSCQFYKRKGSHLPQDSNQSNSIMLKDTRKSKRSNRKRKKNNNKRKKLLKNNRCNKNLTILNFLITKYEAISIY